MAAETPMATKSPLVKGLPEYQLRLLFLPKPRSSMALEMVSIRARLDMTSGMRILLALFSRFTRLAFLLISTPRACCASEMS